MPDAPIMPITTKATNTLKNDFAFEPFAFLDDFERDDALADAVVPEEFARTELDLDDEVVEEVLCERELVVPVREDAVLFDIDFSLFAASCC